MATVVVNSSLVLARIKKMQKEVEKGLKKGARLLGSAMVRDAKKAAPVSTGDLRRRIKAAINELQGGSYLEIEVGVASGVGANKPLPYARIQDLGGIILPRRAQKLAIPVHPSFKTKAGVSGVRARDVIAKPKSFGFRDTYTTDKAILGTPNYLSGQKRPDPVVLFARVESVFIHGTRYLADTKIEALQRGPRIILEQVNAAIAAANPSTP